MKLRSSSMFILIGIVLLALNLRPAAVSVGPVLQEIQDGLGMSGTVAGLLTSLPVLAFAVFGALAPAVARRIGPHRASLIALGMIAVGLTARAFSTSSAAMLAWSLFALIGMAVANVLLPSLVKLHFPDKIGTVTAIYSTVLSAGMCLALVLTVPITNLGGSWRVGIGAWAVLAVVAALPWLGLIRHDRAMEPATSRYGFAQVLRTKLGICLAVLFGLQSMQAYIISGWFASLFRDNGYTANQAGLLVGLLTATSVPLALVVPALVARARDPRPIMVGVLSSYLIGYGMLLFAPHALAIPAGLFVGVGMTSFPLVLLLIGMRARTAAGTAALSSTTQSTGYLIAAGGPFAFGLLHDVTGGWTVPLIGLMIIVLPMLALAYYLGSERYLEDQIGPAQA